MLSVSCGIEHACVDVATVGLLQLDGWAENRDSYPPCCHIFSRATESQNFDLPPTQVQCQVAACNLEEVTGAFCTAPVTHLSEKQGRGTGGWDVTQSVSCAS